MGIQRESVGIAGRDIEAAAEIRRIWFARSWAALRLIVVVVVAAATGEQVRLAVVAAEAAGIAPALAVLRLFTFFTVLSNVSLMIVFAIAGVRSFVRREVRDPRWLAILLAAMSACMLVTGLVYNLVLRSAGVADISGGWSNDVHHVIAPLIVLADVLIAPRRRRLAWSSLPWGLLFPIVWVLATLMAAPFRVDFSTGNPPWYPYPFLDPADVGGYGGVALWVAGISALIAGLLAAVIQIGRWRDRVTSGLRNG